MQEILAVDDDHNTLQLIHTILSHQGYHVTMCSNGMQALDELSKNRFDLIVVDLHMPRMGGIEVIRTLRAQEEYGGLPIIVITATANESQCVEALEAGADDLLSKPFSTSELVARIRTHLRVGHLVQTLAEKVDELKKVEHLKEDLTSMLVHDMKNPLAALYGTLELLENPEQHKSENITRHLRRLKSGCTRLSNFITNILDVWASERKGFNLAREETDVASFIHDTIHDYEVLFSYTEGVRILTDISPSLPRVCVDPGILHRILLNLLDNAIKHSPRAGEIRIAAEGQGDTIRISVKDQGPGIPPELHEKIFQKYGAVQAQKQGILGSTGLGLAFCKLAVEAHGGSIGLVSEPGHGATFTITLPAP